VEPLWTFYSKTNLEVALSAVAEGRASGRGEGRVEVGAAAASQLQDVGLRAVEVDARCGVVEGLRAELLQTSRHFGSRRLTA